MKKSVIFKLISFVALLGLFVSCTSAPKASEGALGAASEGSAQKIELESGVIEGNVVVNDFDGQEFPAASGDILYMKDTGLIKVEFNVPSAGSYLVKVFYAIPTDFGDKANFVLINGESLGELPFPQTNSKWAAKWLQVDLVEGVNTVAIEKSWGYTWFDYLTVEKL